MKKSLSELKKVVQEHKRNLPKLNSGKSALYKFASDRGLLGDVETMVEKPLKRSIIEKKVEVAVEEVKPKTKKVKEDKPYIHPGVLYPEPKKTKVEKVVKEVKDEVVKKPKAISLSAVQAIKKDRNVSLKEAWAIFKAEN
jgi:hypothetical protein